MFAAAYSASDALSAQHEAEKLQRLKTLQAEIGMSDADFDEIYKKHGFGMTEHILLMCRTPAIPFKETQEVLDTLGAAFRHAIKALPPPNHIHINDRTSS